MKDGAEPQRVPAGELVAERLVEQRPHLGRRVAGVAVEVGLDLEQVGQHLERVAVDVQMVVGVLADAAQCLELRQHPCGRAQFVQQREPAQRLRAGEQQPQLGQLTLPRGLRRTRRRVAGEAHRLGIEREPEFGAQPGRAEDPQRVVGEGALGDRPQDPRLEIGGGALRVDDLAAVGELKRDRVDREVALAQVGLDRIAAQATDVGVP